MRCVVCNKKSQSDHCFLHKPKKPMRKEAVKTKEKRLAVTQEWLELNPADEEGTWTCYLQIAINCRLRMNIGTLNIEHDHSKARRPDLKYNVKKLKPACSPCNELKGSLSGDEVINKYRGSK